MDADVVFEISADRLTNKHAHHTHPYLG